MIRPVPALAIAAILILTGCTTSTEPDAASGPAATLPPGALDQMAIAFEGGHSRAEIKARLDSVMLLYGLELSEENYSRAGSTLVALRRDSGIPEMEILDYMARSYVPGTSITFPEAAGIATAALRVGAR